MKKKLCVVALVLCLSIAFFLWCANDSAKHDADFRNSVISHYSVYHAEIEITSRIKGLASEKRISEWVQNRNFRKEVSINEGPLVTYISSGRKQWKVVTNDGDSVAEQIWRRNDSEPRLESFLFSLMRILAVRSNKLHKEEREGKEVLRFVSRDSGTSPSLVIDIFADEFDFQKIRAIDISLTRDQEMIFHERINIVNRAWDINFYKRVKPDGSFFSLPDSVEIDENKSRFNKIMAKTLHPYSSYEDVVKGILLELEDSGLALDSYDDYYERVGNYYLALGQLEKGVESLEKSIDLKPRADSYLALVGAYLMQYKDQKMPPAQRTQVRRYIKEAFDLDQSSGILAACARSADMAGLHEEAAEYYELALATKPYDFIMVNDRFMYIQGSTKELLKQKKDGFRY